MSISTLVYIYTRLYSLKSNYGPPPLVCATAPQNREATTLPSPLTDRDLLRPSKFLTSWPHRTSIRIREFADRLVHRAINTVAFMAGTRTA